MTQEDLDRERAIFLDQAKAEGKPEEIAAKIVDGRMKKFYSQVCLMEQSYVKDPDKTISDLMKEGIAKFGENMQLTRFTRFKLGESIEG